jgi:hypothetical protein
MYKTSKTILFSIMSFTFVLTGCSQLSPTYPTSEEAIIPELNTVRTINVGEVIITEYKKYVIPSIEIEESIYVNSGSRSRDRINISSRDIYLSAFSDKNQLFCNDNVCLQDSNQDNKIDTYYMRVNKNIVNQTLLDKPIKYKRKKSIFEDDKAFNYELLFQGMANDVIRLLYREYTGNMARPAFHQELTYTIKGEYPFDINFRNEKIRIHKIEDNTLSYEILSSF